MDRIRDNVININSNVLLLTRTYFLDTTTQGSRAALPPVAGRSDAAECRVLHDPDTRDPGQVFSVPVL